MILLFFSYFFSFIIKLCCDVKISAMVAAIKPRTDVIDFLVFFFSFSGGGKRFVPFLSQAAFYHFFPLFKVALDKNLKLFGTDESFLFHSASIEVGSPCRALCIFARDSVSCSESRLQVSRISSTVK